MTSEQLVVLVLFALGVVILVTWWIRMQANVTATQDVEACRISVEGYADLRMEMMTVDTHFVNIDCDRRVVTFTEDHVELNGKTVAYRDPLTNKTQKRYRRLTPAIVNSVAAAEMATCWYQFLEGKRYWTDKRDIGNNDQACFVCGELRFEAPSPTEPFPYTAAEQTLFIDYLATNESRPYPRILGKERPTYLEYLYLEPHLCDNSRKSKIEGQYWYLDSDTGTCEEMFLARVLLGEDLNTGPMSTYALKQILGLEGYTPLMKGLKLVPTSSYLVVFYQLGEDQGTTETGEVAGTTYAPILIPTTSLTTDLCPVYLG